MSVTQGYVATENREDAQTHEARKPSITATTKSALGVAPGNTKHNPVTTARARNNEASKPCKDMSKNFIAVTKSKIDNSVQCKVQSKLKPFDESSQSHNVAASANAIAHHDDVTAAEKVVQAEKECILKPPTVEACVAAQPIPIIEPRSTNRAADSVNFSEYADDIYHYMKSIEAEYTVKSYPFANHSSLKPTYRSILINWLVLVHEKFRFANETLYLCVSIFDRYVQRKSCIAREKLQLVGITSLLLAAKVEEMRLPPLDSFLYVADNAYSVNEMLRTEINILQEIQFALNAPHSLLFLRRFSRVTNVSATMHTLAKYFMELGLVAYDFATLPPSKHAAAALYMAMAFYNMEWDEEACCQTGYTFEQLSNVIKRYCELLPKSSTSRMLASIFDKYAKEKFHRISTRILPQMEHVLRRVSNRISS